MAGALRDFRDIWVPLVLPINGKQYTVPPVSADTGLLLALVGAEDSEASADAERELNGDWHRRMLGTAYDEMIADQVPWPALDRAASAALADHQHGRLAAIAVWDVAADPKGLAELLRATKELAATP